ncbi:hypothetical protein [Acidithiobacillus ferrooxidans]|uniref:hypothetical protein n=1 Tax=Acidithiobacillus ferrooxidans TaxID=920 RepID=UPI000B29A29F|nr:hypothetical protein [Acidithiobacillus ferrooxidans]
MKDRTRIAIELAVAAAFAATLTFLFYHAIRPQAVHGHTGNSPAICGAAAAAAGGGASAIR